MKKIAGIVLLIFSLFIGVFLVAWSLGTECYNDMIVSTEEFENIISSRAEADELVDAILFDEETLFYDKKGIYYYSLIEDSPTSENPRIKLSADNNLRIAFLNEKITENTVKNNVTIDFIVYTDEYYHQYGLKCTTLPLMNISCPEEIGDENIEMDILLFDNRADAYDRFTVSDGTIHVRGASTRSLPKKSYRLHLVRSSLGGNTRDNDISLLGMRQDDDWLLYSAYNEPTKAKNVFASNLWENSCAVNNSVGADTGMEYRYLELFVNNEYYGLYALGFPIDRKQLKLQSGTGELYKKSLWAADASLEGYSVEGYGEENRDYLREFYEYLDKNKYDINMLMSYVDIDNLIDVQLFINLVQGEDNVGTKHYSRGQNSTYLKNIYLCIRETDSGLLGLYCPWDLDLTWRSDPDKNYLIETGYLDQMIADGDTDVIERMCDRYWELRETHWSDESLVEMLNRMENDIFGSGAYAREFERWSSGSYMNSSEGGLSDFKHTVLDRVHQTDLYYLRLEENAEQSYYVIRSLQYKDFKDYNFIVKIGDYELIREPEYRDLLEYIGIEVEQIDETIKFAAVDSEGGRTEYIDRSVNVGESLITCAGTLYINPEPVHEDEPGHISGAYSVYVDDVYSFDSNDYLEQNISLIMIKDDDVELFNFSKDFYIAEKNVN